MKECKTLLYIFYAPLVLSPPQEGWGVPDSLKKLIIPSRIMNVISGDFDKGLSSIADMVIHLNNASLKYPIPPEYVRIYIYYTDKLLNGKIKESGAIEVPEITEYEKTLADELRRGILSRQMKELKKISKKIKC